MTPANTTGRPRLLTARPLMMCVVLGAFTALIVLGTRVLSLAIAAALPWLAYPAPTPWFLAIIMAPMLVRLPGAALVTGVVGLVGGGGMGLFAALIVELMVLPMRRHWRLTRMWAVTAGILIGCMTFGFMFVVPEFNAISPSLKLLALAVRVATGALYGWLAWSLARALVRAGIGERTTG